MGFYFDSDGMDFKDCVKRRIFIDKSMLIDETNQAIENGNKFICVTGPRRFGKTYNANMLLAYYTCGDDTKNLFSKLRIAKSPLFKQYINNFHVLFLNPMNFIDIVTKEKSLTYWTKFYALKEMKKAFPDLDVNSNRLNDYISAIYEKTKKRFVIIIDEYDYVFREYPEDKKQQDEYLDFLNVLFKSSDVSRCIALAYLTGIMPIMRDKTQSKLNNFQDISMLDGRNYSDFIGFTEDEVKNLCYEYRADFSKMKHWYDGYDFCKNHNVYNPYFVVLALQNGVFKDYWTLTSSSETIDPFIDSNFEGVKDDIVKLIGGESIKVHPVRFNKTIEGIKNRDDIFTYFVHLGYLTYDPDETDSSFGWVRIPNFEIRQEFQDRIDGRSFYSYAWTYISESRKLLEETLAGNSKYVENALDKAHEKYSSILTYNDENSLSCVLRLAYNFAEQDCTIIRELPSGKGFVDFAFIPVDNKRPALLVELKKDKPAKTAIDQIEHKDYPEVLVHYKNNLILVGISYDSKKKKHSCLIEKA